MIGFAAAGPNTRTQQVCLFLGAVPSLGRNSVETPIGQVGTEIGPESATRHDVPGGGREPSHTAQDPVDGSEA